MGELGRARCLEARDLAELRVQPGQHPADGPVLARGVHALEDEENGAGVLGTESGEELVELADRGFDPLVGPVLVVEAETVARIAVLQTGGPTRPDPQSVDERPVVSRVRALGGLVPWSRPLSTGARRRPVVVGRKDPAHRFRADEPWTATTWPAPLGRGKPANT